MKTSVQKTNPLIASPLKSRPRRLPFALLTLTLGLVGPCLALQAEPAPGSVIWEKRYSSPGTSLEGAEAVAVDSVGNVVVTGSSWNASASANDYYTAKYAAANGALLWAKRYNGPGNSHDEAQAVAVDRAGNVVVTGYSRGVHGVAGYHNNDLYTAKYAATNGALLWEKRYNGPANGSDEGRAVAVDGAGNVIVIGWVATHSNSFESPRDNFYTAKYAATNGALLWEKHYNGPADDDDLAYGLAVDNAGNVVVTGGSRNASGDFDCYTAKYAAANGALLWEKRYNGSANADDLAWAVAVDSAGDVVITGGSDPDGYTAKYAAADGALIWEKRSVGGGGALALDRAGNVVIAGSSYNADENDDFYAAKFAARDGALLWEKSYDGPGKGSDFAESVAVDGAGNVFATGSSDTALDGPPAYYTAKYATADGAVLWEARYNGPGDSWDRARDLAVDGAGDVVVTGRSSDDYYTVKYEGSVAAPTNTPPLAIADDYVTDEDAVLTITRPGVLENDTDADGDPLTVGTASMTAKGTLVVQADGSFTYTPNANYNGPDEFTYEANDGTEDSNVVVVTLTIKPVNDAPINTVPGPQSTGLNRQLSFSSANGNALAIADVDAGGSEVRVTLTVTNGSLTLRRLTGLTFSTGDGRADPTMTFRGTLTRINAALDGLVFAPKWGFSGMANLTITSNDQGNAGAGGALRDKDPVAITVRSR